MCGASWTQPCGFQPIKHKVAQLQEGKQQLMQHPFEPLAHVTFVLPSH